MSKPKTISILGCGWLGLPLGKHYAAKGLKVKGSTTSESKLPQLAENSITPYLIHIEDKIEGDFADFLQDVDILIINFPPKRIPNIREVHKRQIELIINQLPRNQKTIFVSSTSVYQNTNGVVSEELELDPEKESGKALVEGEQLLRNYLQDDLTVLRLAGLVGYDRLPGRFLANKKDVKNGAAPINVIHQDDCIGLIERIIEEDKWGAVYNGCADEHPLRKDYYTRAAEKIGLVPPCFSGEAQSSFKIISNEKSKKELGYQYKYPDPIQML